RFSRDWSSDVCSSDLRTLGDNARLKWTVIRTEDHPAVYRYHVGGNVGGKPEPRTGQLAAQQRGECPMRLVTLSQQPLQYRMVLLRQPARPRRRTNICVLLIHGSSPGGPQAAVGSSPRMAQHPRTAAVRGSGTCLEASGKEREPPLGRRTEGDHACSSTASVSACRTA